MVCVCVFRVLLIACVFPLKAFGVEIFSTRDVGGVPAKQRTLLNSSSARTLCSHPDTFRRIFRIPST